MSSFVQLVVQLLICKGGRNSRRSSSTILDSAGCVNVTAAFTSWDSHPLIYFLPTYASHRILSSPQGTAECQAQFVGMRCFVTSAAIHKPSQASRWLWRPIAVYPCRHCYLRAQCHLTSSVVPNNLTSSDPDGRIICSKGPVLRMLSPAPLWIYRPVVCPNFRPSDVVE